MAMRSAPVEWVTVVEPGWEAAPRRFVRDDLETAWLVQQDEKTYAATVRRLHDEFGWQLQRAENTVRVLPYWKDV